MILTRSADAKGAGAPPWQESFTARLEALALLQTLNAELLSQDSATLTLDSWCAAHQLASSARIVAERAAARSKRRRTSSGSFSTSAPRSLPATAECASSAATTFSRKRITGTYPLG
jgi:hypothetical protein